MNDMQAFFAQNNTTEITEDVVVSTRFRGKDGQPIPWKLRSISESENQALRKSCLRKIRGKGGKLTPEFDSDAYLNKLVVASVVFPDPKNVELQNSYGVMGAENVLSKMLLPGEYGTLLQKVQEINGYDQEMDEVVADVKNE